MCGKDLRFALKKAKDKSKIQELKFVRWSFVSFDLKEGTFELVGKRRSLTLLRLLTAE